jgi:hypothetical protein
MLFSETELFFLHGSSDWAFRRDVAVFSEDSLCCHWMLHGRTTANYVPLQFYALR